MALELRKTGITFVGDVPWGTHFCHFYETKEDLLDILLPYFKAGLENNEFCLWVVSEPLTEQDAREGLRAAVPHFDRYMARGSLEIVTARDWYLEGGYFDSDKVTNRWHARLARALGRGYDGMRGSGMTAWLETKDWDDFDAYENQVSDSIMGQPISLLCTYPLEASGAAEILDVARSHRFAIAKRRGEWEVVETPELKQAKADIVRLNEELEQRVIERTAALSESEERFRQMAENIREVFWMRTPDHSTLYISPAYESVWGRTCESLYRDPSSFIDTIHPEDRARVLDSMERDREQGFEVQYRVVRPDGSIRWIRDRGFPIRDESGRFYRIAGIAEDITERRQAEALLNTREQEFRAIVENAPDQIVRYDR